MSVKTKRILFACLALLPLCICILACFRTGSFTLPVDTALSHGAVNDTLTYVYKAVSGSTSDAVPYYVQWLAVYMNTSLMISFADLVLAVFLWIPDRVRNLFEGGARQ